MNRCLITLLSLNLLTVFSVSCSAAHNWSTNYSGAYFTSLEDARKLFNSLDDLLTDNTIMEEGGICKTRGYYKSFDGGGATYVIYRSKPNGYSERLRNGYYAKLIDDVHNVRCYGATEGIDCSMAIQNAIYNNKGGYVVFPEGRFILEKPVNVKGFSITITGMGDCSIIGVEGNVNAFEISNLSTQRLTVKDICFEGKGKGTALQLGKDEFCLNTLIEHCVFRDLKTAISLNKEVDNLTVRDCYFLMNVNGIYCDDISTNKSSLRIVGNHFQMQKSGGVSVYLEIGSSVNISDNLFQAAQRENITFMRVYDMNQVVIDNNYLEISNSKDASNNIGIDVNYLNGAKISHTRAQGHMHSVVRVLNSYSTEIDPITYSSLGYKIPSLIENKTGQKRKNVVLNISKETVQTSNSSVKYIDNIEGVEFGR